MADAKHTTTPWRESYVSDGGLTSIVGPNGEGIADKVAFPDASLIVTAINERQALLKCEEALREARAVMARDGYTDKGLAFIDSALSLLDEARNGK